MAVVVDPMTFVILDCDCAVLVGISIHTGRDWGPPADVGEYVGVVDADDADICLCDACCSHSNAYYWNLALSRWFHYLHLNSASNDHWIAAAANAHSKRQAAGPNYKDHLSSSCCSQSQQHQDVHVHVNVQHCCCCDDDGCYCWWEVKEQLI